MYRAIIKGLPQPPSLHLAFWIDMKPDPDMHTPIAILRMCLLVDLVDEI